MECQREDKMVERLNLTLKFALKPLSNVVRYFQPQFLVHNDVDLDIILVTGMICSCLKGCQSLLWIMALEFD